MWPEGYVRYRIPICFIQLPLDSVVAMNMWGFHQSILKELQDRFAGLLKKAVVSNPLKAEYFLPSVVRNMLREGKATVEVLTSKDKWYGVTY